MHLDLLLTWHINNQIPTHYYWNYGSHISWTPSSGRLPSMDAQWNKNWQTIIHTIHASQIKHRYLCLHASITSELIEDNVLKCNEYARNISAQMSNMMMMRVCVCVCVYCANEYMKHTYTQFKWNGIIKCACVLKKPSCSLDIWIMHSKHIFPSYYT